MVCTQVEEGAVSRQPKQGDPEQPVVGQGNRSGELGLHPRVGTVDCVAVSPQVDDVDDVRSVGVHGDLRLAVRVHDSELGEAVLDSRRMQRIPEIVYLREALDVEIEGDGERGVGS